MSAETHTYIGPEYLASDWDRYRIWISKGFDKDQVSSLLRKLCAKIVSML